MSARRPSLHSALATKPRPSSLGYLIALIAAAAALIACQEDRFTTGPTRQGTPTAPQDMGDSADDGEPSTGPNTPATICIPGTIRCLAQDSPLFERCGQDGTTLNTQSCASGQICRQDQCIPFSCTPDRPICLGPTTVATCDPSGLGVIEPTICPQGQSCRSGYCVDLCEEAAQDKSYIGCEYIAQELPNYYRVEESTTQESPYAIILTNPHPLLSISATVTTPLGQPATLIDSITLKPSQQSQISKPVTVNSAVLDGTTTLAQLQGQSKDIIIPPKAAAVLLMETNQGQNGTFFVKTDHPSVAYQFSPYCCNFTFTNDASLLLPTTTLQNRYRVLSYPTMRTQGPTEVFFQPYLYLVAQQDETIINIESPVELTDVYTEIGQVSTGQAPSKQWTLKLNRGQSRILALKRDLDADLSGALITSNHPIAAFSGHPCTFVPRAEWACDHLEEQLPPAQTLGKAYTLPALVRRNPDFKPTADRPIGERVYWRISADEDAKITASISFSDVNTAIDAPSNPVTPSCRSFVQGDHIALKAGQTCEFGTAEALSLESDAPIIVGGVISGHSSTALGGYGKQAGDPAFFILPPVEQFRTNYSFVTAPTFKKTYAAILSPERATVALDGRQISARRRLESKLITLDGQRWRLYSIALDPGVHQLVATEPVGIIVYAYDDYVSYAFPGGLDLRPGGKK